jgi:glycogen debranching enzyme
MALFGRESLLTAYISLPFQPRLAATTLRALAALQATEDDAYRDAEPGQILHQLRCGMPADSGQVPHRPYYGSHDATPLFLILLDEYDRWSGDVDVIRELEPAARAAVAWIEGPGDLDGDGYLEYRTRSTAGLANQCWKDSWNSILFADGRLAVPPIATCELQGYAFDARLRSARPARRAWGDAAARRPARGRRGSPGVGGRRPAARLRALLGLDPDRSSLRCEPCVPTRLGHLWVRRVAFRGNRVDTP